MPIFSNNSFIWEELQQQYWLSSDIGKVIPYLSDERWARSWSRSLGSQLKGDLVINLAVGCHYFPPGPRLPYQLKSITAPWPAPNYNAWWQRHTGQVAHPRPLRSGAQSGLEPATCKSQIRCPTNSTTVSVKHIKYRAFLTILWYTQHNYSLRWRENVGCLQFYCQTVPMSYMVDQRKILLWKKALNCDNKVVYTIIYD